MADLRLPFGTHAGERISDVVREHPRYALWLCSLGESTWNKYPASIFRELRRRVGQHLLDQVAGETADKDRAARRRAIREELFGAAARERAADLL